MDQNEILKFVEPILCYCKRRLSNSHDAEDLASEIILHVLSGMQKYKIESLDAWVWRVAHNRYANYVNEQGKNRMLLSCDETLLDEAVSNNVADPNGVAETLDESDERQKVFQYLHTLAAEYKNIFVDHYLEKMSVRELSVKYSLPETTIKWRLNVGRQRIRERMGENKMDKIYKRINWNTTICNGNMDPDRYLHSQIARAICRAAYVKPLTVEEISIATGIPTMYVEDELPRLLYGDAMKKIGYKYATNFIILSLEDKRKLRSVSTELVRKLADSFAKSFTEKADEVKKQRFYGHDFGMKRLGYIVVPYVLRNAIKNAKLRLGFENGAFPLRKDGGNGWFVVEETEDEREIISENSSGCNAAVGEGNGESAKRPYIYYYWICKYFDTNVYHGYGIKWLCDNDIMQSIENGMVKTKLTDETAAALIGNNLVYKDKDVYKLRFACYETAEFSEFVSKFELADDGSEQLLLGWIRDLRSTFARFVPKSLDSQINQWVSNYANQIVGLVTEELIRRGTLESTKADMPMTNGVFCILGDRVGSI